MTRAAEVPRGGSGAMFDAIAARYDLLNRVLSLGVDQGWRRKTVAALALAPGARVLDLATGTADLALQIARAPLGVRVTGLDPSGGMLAIARRKIAAAELDGRITLTRGDAEELPFASGRFDAVSMAFGIRNVVDRPRALAEMARVVRPGGRIAILELSEPDGGVLAPLARFHIHTVVPRVGAFLSGARAYRYLHDSIARFPPPAEFVATMERAGLAGARAQPLTFGVACLFIATRAEAAS